MKRYLFLLYTGLTIFGNSIFAAVPVMNLKYTKHTDIVYKKAGNDLFIIKRNGISDINSNNAGTEPHLRLQLYKDAINTDDTYIGFEPTAKAQYVFNQDAPYTQGYGEISLASFSSDNVKLAINRLPLPAKSEDIKLYVNATTDGSYKLNMTEDEGIPQLFEVWLIDAYKKDSLDMRQIHTYAFDLLKADTNSFGSNRFKLVIRQNPALAMHLLAFTAVKSSDGTQIAWKTENEQGYTNFNVERSTDGGGTYNGLDSLISDSLGTYSFLDKTPSPVTDQYRLKIQDLTGAISYSNVVTLTYSNANITHNSIIIYPNPASNTINLSLVSNDTTTDNSTGQQPANGISGSVPIQNTGIASYNVKIINIDGIIVKTVTTNSQYLQTDVSNLSPGTYIIHMVKNGDSSIAGKSTFIKL